MKLKIRPEDVSTHEMSDWLAWLRAEVAEEPGEDETRPETVAPAPPASSPPPSVKTVADREDTCRAVIGDELRIPMAWCELGSCISHYTDPAARGEADIRTRALRAGWSFDRFGRLACADCQQSDPRFRAAYPVVLWDRRAAVTRAAMMATSLRDDDANGGTSAAPPPVIPAVASVAGPPAGQRAGGRHRKQQ